MKIALQIRIMIAALRKNSMRALLALICVGLGVASVMVTLSLSTGAEQELKTISDKVGKNIFVINAANIQARPGRAAGWFKSTRLRQEDVSAIREQIDGVIRAVPVSEASLKVKFNSRDFMTNVKGVDAEYFAARNFQISNGRLFDGDDDDGMKRVAVVGPFVSQKINDGRDLVGNTIWLGGIPFEVIGQLKEKGVSSDGTNEDDQVLVPLHTALHRLFSIDYLSSILVQTDSEERMGAVQQRAASLLRGTHGLDVDVKNDFEILSLIKANVIRKLSSQFLRGMSQMFAAITLAIGGAGVFAVTYLNVKDRTSEIGLRMAIGARRRDIAMLFIAEACLLSVIGGIAGLAVGASGVSVLRRFTDWSMTISPIELLLPFSISILMGVICSLLPAMKASHLTPMEALRNI